MTTISTATVRRRAPVPDVSVVIPAYNSAATLPASLESVLSQDASLEVIVVDDGSTDATSEVLAHVSDPRVTVLRNSANRGLTAAINRGFKKAAGRTLCYLDSDDKLPKKALATRLSALSVPGVDGVVTDLTVRGRGTFLVTEVDHHDPEALARFLSRSPRQPFQGLNHPTLLISRECARSAGYRDPGWYPHSDYEWLLRMLFRFHIAVVHESTYDYTVGRNPHSIRTTAGSTEEADILLARLERDYHARTGARSRTG